MRLQAVLHGTTLVLFALLQHEAQASRILYLAPIVGTSHGQLHAAIVTTLANHGHEMTYVTPYAPKQENSRIRKIVLPHLDLAPLIPNVFEDGSYAFKNITYIAIEFCAKGLQDPKVTKLFNETFDMIIMPPELMDCFLVFQHHFRVPFVLVNPGPVMPPLDVWFGNPSFPSYDVSVFIGSDPPLSFETRAYNIFMEIFVNGMIYLLRTMTRTASQSMGLLPDDMPSFDALYSNASLLILNSYRAMETPRPFVHNIIHAGGIHLNPTKPLPQKYYCNISYISRWTLGKFCKLYTRQ
ncbi:UDP-glucosyltransferase 2-like [Oratosquilla oratoria]|uniref:UDP-glucosyltransferase 2-like n=1 Tax=Oratosquilla oratoria TaxID=337810 RepID=UPI003F760D11